MRLLSQTNPSPFNRPSSDSQIPTHAMSSSLLHPPAHLPPSVALKLSQQAPTLLQSIPSSISSYSISSLWSAAETPELWTTYEHLMLSCLRTGDEESAHLCLQRLTERFGADNERLMALRGIFQEARAADEAALKNILKEYDTILAQNPENMVRPRAQSATCLILLTLLACLETQNCAPKIPQ